MSRSYFGDNFNAVGVDFYDVALVFVIVVLGICMCLGLPGSDYTQRAKSCAVVIIGYLFGAIILGLQVSHHWETAYVETELALPHPQGLQHPCNSATQTNLTCPPSTVTVHLGLRGINVTFSNLKYGFHFNEKFEWAWNQGREGFGPFAGPFQRQFRDGQRAGFPRPVLKVADVFAHDGEGIRYGRMYRIAGWHTHSIIWAAFLFWIMAVLCFQFSVVPAAKFLGLSGFTLLLANILWACLSPALDDRPPTVLLGTVTLQLRLGGAYYLCLVTSLLAMILAIGLLLMEAHRPIETAVFFGLDPFVTYEECYCDVDEAERYIQKSAKRSTLSRSIRRTLARFSLKQNEVETVDLIQQPPAEMSSRTNPKEQAQQILLRRRRDSSHFTGGWPTSPNRRTIKSSFRLEKINEADQE